MKRKCQVSLQSVIVAVLTPLVAPLLDSRSLERTKPISLNSQRPAETDAKVLYSNFTAIHPHHWEGAEGSGHWRPEGEEMGSDTGFMILFSAFLLLKVLWLTDKHTHTYFSTTGAHIEVYLHYCNLKCSYEPSLPVTPHKLQLKFTLCPLYLHLHLFQWGSYNDSDTVVQRGKKTYTAPHVHTQYTHWNM